MWKFTKNGAESSKGAMKITNFFVKELGPRGTVGPLVVAVIGMPRTGTTIFSRYLSSLGESLIVGEPHRMLEESRSSSQGPVTFPIICDSPYGALFLRYYSDKPLDQIIAFAKHHGVSTMVGFKETWSNFVDPIDLIMEYSAYQPIHRVFVCVRDPIKTYKSILYNTPEDREVLPVERFAFHYIRLAHACNPEISPLGDKDVTAIDLDHFRKWPRSYLEDRTGWKIDGPESPTTQDGLVMYTGGGDIMARAAVTKISPKESSLDREGCSWVEADQHIASAKKAWLWLADNNLV